MPTPSPRVTEVVGKHSPTPRQVRISAKVRHALRLMAFEGASRKEAAEAAGLKDDSLYVALRKPEVKRLLNEYVGDLRKSEASRSIARVASLASSAKSEAVKLDANKFLLGIEGVRPSESVQHDHVHVHLPGYVLDPGQPDTRRPEYLRDVTPGAPQIADLAIEQGKEADNCASVPQGAKGTGRVGVDSEDE